MTTKHTAGEWIDRGTYCVGTHRQLVASVYPMPEENPEEHAANMRLIAAAPDLLRYLKEARRTLEMWKDVAPAVSLCADIDAAIARATGEPKTAGPETQLSCAGPEGSMSKHTTDLNNLFESYFHELRAMSDDDVLDGEAAQTVKARALERLKAAKAEGGRRRLAIARANMRDSAPHRAEGGEDVTPAAARTYVTRAANDARYTMDARKLDELTDEDVLRLYRQLRMLESDSEADDKP